MSFGLLQKIMGIHETVKRTMGEGFKGDLRLYVAGQLEDAGLPCVSFQRPLPTKAPGQALKVLKLIVQCPKEGEVKQHVCPTQESARTIRLNRVSLP
jgi:hypothetical protein